MGNISDEDLDYIAQSVNTCIDIPAILMPIELKEVAALRLEHPEASLKEIGQMLEEPIGKSGINHRMKRIHDLAEEIRK